MTDDEFFGEQGQILKNLANALVEATPEWWNDATLELEQTSEGCAHSIFSANHPNDIVVPTDEIYEATAQLEDLFANKSQSWKKAVLKLTRSDRRGEESWQFKVEYSY